MIHAFEHKEEPTVPEWKDPFGTCVNQAWRQMGAEAFARCAETQQMPPRAIFASLTCITNLPFDTKERLLAALLASNSEDRNEFIYRTYMQAERFTATDRAHLLAALIEAKNPEWLCYVLMDEKIKMGDAAKKKVVAALAATNDRYFIDFALKRCIRLASAHRKVLSSAVGYTVT